jgi:hypothetical protein
MAKGAWSDIAAGGKVVFVNTNAGQANFGTGPVNSSINTTPYYKARQMGHERAIRFWANMTGQPVFTPAPATRVMIANKAVWKTTINSNIVLYNIVFPDAINPANVQSSTSPIMLNLVKGTITTLMTLDGSSSDPSTIYTYNDFKNVIRGIISTESHGVPTVFMNYPDENMCLNSTGAIGSPCTHADHLATGIAVHDVLTDKNITAYGCVYPVKFQDYSNAFQAANYTQDEQYKHLGTWGALNSGLADGGSATSWDTYDPKTYPTQSGFSQTSHMQYLFRQYGAWDGLSKPPCAF